MGQIQRRVYAVVELYDCFTRKPVLEGSCHVVSERKKNVIAKENGIFVFLEESEKPEVEITFFSEIYHSKSIALSELSGSDNYRRKILWMTPNENYVYPLQAAIVLGKLPAQQGKRKNRFHMVLEKEEHPIYLAKDYETGDLEIAVHGFLNEQPVGAEGVFYADGKPVSEIFGLAGRTDEEGVYRLREPLKKSYKKGEALLHRAYFVYEKEDGSFLIAFSGLRGKKVKCDLLRDGKIAETWEIEAGKNERKE
jgi:hypothetical protein